jgi:nucleoside-diphosphate-sugar epimerase
MKRDRYLITGATGFVGGAVARALTAAGEEVHGVSLSDRPGPAGVVMHRVDLLSAPDVAEFLESLRPTHLVHAAWDVTHGVYWTSPANFTWLAAGANLLRRFIAVGGERAVGIGTCAEYGWTEDRYRERSSPLQPATPYGRCKLALCHAFEAALQMGVSTAWARLFFPYGPGDGQRRLLPALFTALESGKPFPMTAGTQVRDFIHIDDVGCGIAALARSNVSGPVNLGAGEGASLRDLALTAAGAMEADPALLRFGEIPTSAGDPPVLIADIGRLRDEVGFEPVFGWQDGVRRLALSRRSARSPSQVERVAV